MNLMRARVQEKVEKVSGGQLTKEEEENMTYYILNHYHIAEKNDAVLEALVVKELREVGVYQHGKVSRG